MHIGGITLSIYRVLIVDGDARVRRALRALLESAPEMMVVGEAATVAQAAQVDLARHPSVILIDLMLPTVHDGLAAVQLLGMHKRPCIVTSWRSSLREAALEAGACGFIEKGSSPEVLLNAVRTACRAGDLQIH